MNLLCPSKKRLNRQISFVQYDVRATYCTVGLTDMRVPKKGSGKRCESYSITSYCTSYHTAYCLITRNVLTDDLSS